MKYIGIIQTLLLSFFLMVSCQPEDDIIDKDTEKAIADLRKVDTEFIAKSNDFSFRLFDEVISTEPNDKNILISPLSINIALGMLLNGAEANTADQIISTLGLEGTNMEEINAGYSNLISALPNLDQNVTMSIANSVWYDHGFQVKDPFLQSLEDGFNADVNAGDFSDSNTKDLINNWVKDNTNGLIEKIIDSISPREVMFLINALYFKGDWTYQFDASKTSKQVFTNSNGVEKQVDMMLQNDLKVRGTGGEDFSIFELAYGKEERYALRILLPHYDKSLDEILGDDSNLAWNGSLALGSEFEVTVGLPKFEIKDEYELNGILKTLGITDAFEHQKANLSKIADEPLNVSKVKHKTFMKVDESGTEAAAVTSIGIEATSLPPSYICDRPFAFYIYEREMGNILFMGKVVDIE